MPERSHSLLCASTRDSYDKGLHAEVDASRDPGSNHPGGSLGQSLLILDREPGSDVFNNAHLALPGLIADAGEETARRFLEFFFATIRNKNTRSAYARACWQFFSWCESRGLRSLGRIQPMHVASYVESYPGSVPTVKQH